MGGTKRQETTSLRSSSSLRDTAETCHHPHVNTANVGCMSAIFQLVSKYHTRRKFLTFGRKQERHVGSRSSSSPTPTLKPETITSTSRDQDISSRSSLDQAPRSPAITVERRGTSPRVVARLMGLHDIPPPQREPEEAVVETAAEKRRKLLGALEKCDDDLKALKKIIDAVRANHKPPPAVVVAVDEREDEEDLGSEGPSPVSVLDRHYHDHELIARSPPSGSYSKRTRIGQILQLQQQQKQNSNQQMGKKKPREEEHAAFQFPNRPSAAIATATLPLHLPTRSTRPMFIGITATSSTRRSRVAMEESVSEVCTDVAQGQSREGARIALLIQDLICSDLVDEVIRDMGCYHVYSLPSSLPFEACKRELCF